jgi:hypothetical protein
MPPSTLNFNKEILFGEFGALIFVNITAPIAAHFTQNTTIISASAVVATLSGGALFWLTTRIYHKKRNNDFEVRKIRSDINYFTPAAIIFGLLVYDPSIYLISNYLLNLKYSVELSVISGQIVAFSLFLLCMNIYRAFLLKYKLKHL